jgi:uncharacterized protein YcbK (DUF882 family)
MFITTSGGETCLNQVSRKSNENKTEEKIKKSKKQKLYNLNEIFPEEFENKNHEGIDYKKIEKVMKNFKNSDYYKFCKKMWSRNKVFL